MNKSHDCTCDGYHTDDADKDISVATLEVIKAMETCPAERRALARVIASRIK